MSMDQGFGAIFNYARAGLAMVGLDGRFLSVNMAFCQILGYSEEELSQKTFKDLTHPDDVENSMQVMAGFLSGKIQAHQTEKRYLHKNGQIIWVNVNICGVRNSDQKITYFVTHITDITHRKAIEENLALRVKELIESEKALIRESGFVQLLQDVAVAANEAPSADAALKYSLERICKHTDWPIGHIYLLGESGPTRNELIPSNIWWSKDPQYAEDFKLNTEIVRFKSGVGMIGRVLESGKPAWVVDVTQEPLYLRARAAQTMGLKSCFAFPILINKEVVAILEFYSSEAITPDQRLLDVVAHIGTQLGRVIERKRYENELIKTREMAIAASKAKTDFLANMSHEIRTPLNALLGTLELFNKTKMTQTQKSYARTAHQAGDALLSVINQILDLTKVEAGKLELEYLPFDLSELVEEITDIFSYSISGKGLQFTVHFDPSLTCELIGDRARLRQILLNLLANAIKFTPKGKITLRIIKQEEVNDEISLRVEIQDEGIGISDEALKTLFQPFSQADASTTREHGGTGLGLAISKRIIQAMGGQIGVNSKLNTGSTFWFTLLIRQGKKLTPRTPKRSDSVPKSLRKTIRILLAEDNLVNQSVGLQMLENLGYQADAVSNGKEVLEALNQAADGYHLILMDCHMPVMDGFQTTDAIRKSEECGDIPIIALTARATKDDREKCLSAGMNDYISKPYKLETLETKIKNWLPRSTSDLDESAFVRLHKLQEVSKKPVIKNVIDLYMKTTPKHLKAIKLAFNKKDFDTLAHEAHSLKSSSATLGAQSLSKMCARIERLAESKISNGLDQIVKGLEKEFKHTKQLLKQKAA